MDAMEQIKADVAYSNTNVKLVGQSSGIAYGELGPTHHSIEDMAWLRLLPNLTVVVPSDRWETREAVAAAAAADGPFFLRISRFPVPDLVRPTGARFTLGKAETLREFQKAIRAADTDPSGAVHMFESLAARARAVGLSDAAAECKATPVASPTSGEHNSAVPSTVGFDGASRVLGSVLEFEKNGDRKSQSGNSLTPPVSPLHVPH